MSFAFLGIGMLTVTQDGGETNTLTNNLHERPGGTTPDQQGIHGECHADIPLNTDRRL